MKANELRIGNFVNLEDKGLYQISSGHDIEEAEDWNGENYITGVPLTEEWLLKFGFVKENKRETMHHSYFYSISHLDSNFCFAYADFRNDWGFYNEYTDSPFAEDEDKKRIISCGIKYVHQLQNLYQALTGEELTAQ